MSNKTFAYHLTIISHFASHLMRWAFARNLCSYYFLLPGERFRDGGCRRAWH